MNDKEPKLSGDVISSDDRHKFIDKVTDVTPSIDRQTDELGSYVVHYRRPTGFVSVYRPSYPEVGIKAGVRGLTDDAFRVIVRDEDEHDDDTTTVITKTYAVHLTDGAVIYDEEESLLDNATGQPVTPPQLYDLENLKEQLGASTWLNDSPVFDQARLNEVMALLDTLRPEDRFSMRLRQP